MHSFAFGVDNTVQFTDVQTVVLVGQFSIWGGLVVRTHTKIYTGSAAN